MRQWVWLLGWIAIGLVASIGGTALAADAPAPDPKPALAWRLDEVSSANLGPDQPEAAWKRSAALLKAAADLDPREPRFQRLRALALMHVGDTDGAIDALVKYRASPAGAGDCVVQAQLIDLYASRQQTLDAKLSYLESLLDNAHIPVEVRAHAAVQCIILLAQKSPQQAADMAKRAVALYPLPEATRQYYERVARQQPVKERVAALLTVLKADLNQPLYIAELARILASNALTDESLHWFDLAVQAVALSGPDRPPYFHDLLTDFGSELIIGGHDNVADTLAGQMIDADPLDADAWFLKLTVGKASGEEVTFGQTMELARNALVKRWNALSDEIVNGRPSAGVAPGPKAGAGEQQAARPAEPGPVIQKIKADKDPREMEAYANVVGDLAWFELYYPKQPQPDSFRQWIDALQEMLPADSPRLLRLQGWAALDAGQPQQARQILSKLADRDVLAALGVFRADEAEHKPADPEQRRALLESHRIGLDAAMVWAALRPGGGSGSATQPAASDSGTVQLAAGQPASTQPARTRPSGASPTTQPAAADLATLLNQFPKPLLLVLDPRTARRVYSLSAEPLSTTVPYGDPMLARLTITNRSDCDLTIGAGAFLRPSIWIDAHTTGLDNRSFPGTAFDQITGQIVLRPGASLSQVARVDENELRQMLDLSPAAATRVGADAILNPAVAPPVAGEQSGGKPAALPGTGGLMATFSRTFVYAGLPLTTPTGKKQFDALVASTNPLDRLAAADLLAGYVRLASRPDTDPLIRQPLQQYLQSLAGLRQDPSPPVSTWATYLLATVLSGGDQKDRVVTEMSGSKDATMRLLSLFAGSGVPPAHRLELAQGLAKDDPDPTVKAAAAATVELISQAATQPTTEPATQPSGPAGPPATQPQGPAGF